MNVDHVWLPHDSQPNYILLQGFTAAMMRTKASPNGKYLWQFRRTAGYAPTIGEAIDIVEAGAEFFHTMHRNPYT